MSNSPPAPKRRRANRACRLCLSCKTKCDEITDLGCRRCRDKKRLCSLIDRTNPDVNGQTPLTGSPQLHLQPSALPSNVIGTTADPGISTVDARVAKLEQDIDTLTRIATPRPSTSWPTPGSTGSVPTASQFPPPIFPASSTSQFPHMHRVVDSRLWDERYHSTAHQDDFPDVVRAGILTADQVDHGYMLFQRKFTNLLYLPPYCNLDVDHNPRDPFLTLATLAYTPYATAVPLPALISQSILVITTGGVSVDAICALFLLALAPVSPEAALRPQPTSSWYLELAHSIGSRLGVEAKVRTALKSPDMLCDAEYTGILELCLLWENVKAKLNIVSLMSTRPDTLTPSMAHLLPRDHPREAYRIAIAQVQLLAKASTAFTGFVDRVIWEETEGLMSGPDGKADHEAWDAMEVQIKELLASPSITELIRSDVECTRQALASRLGAIVRLIPTPFSPTITRSFLAIIGLVLFPALRGMLDSCSGLSNDQLVHLPSYLTTNYAFGMILIRRVMSFTPAAKPGDPERNDHPKLDLMVPVEERLARAGPYQALILSKGKEALDHVAIMNQGAVMGSATNMDPWGGFTFMDLDLSMFDWSALGVQSAA